MKQKIFLTMMVLVIFGFGLPSISHAEGILLIPKKVIHEPQKVTDEIFALLENYDKEESVAVENHNPFSFPTEVSKGLNAYKAELDVANEKLKRQDEIIRQLTQQIQKEQEEKERLAQEQKRQQEQQNSSAPSVQSVPTNAQALYPIVSEMSTKYGVPEAWILGVIEQESGFNVNAQNTNTNGTVDRGLMQLNSNTAPLLAKRLGLPYQVGMEFDPKTNIEMGTVYLAYLKNKTDDPHYIFTAYNRGEGGAKKLYNRQGSYQSSYSSNVMMRVGKY